MSQESEYNNVKIPMKDIRAAINERMGYREVETHEGGQSTIPRAPLRKGHPRFHEIIAKMQELHNAKNADYSEGMKEGPLGNFQRASAIMKLYPKMDWSTPFGVAVVYMLKQLDAMLVLKSTARSSLTGEPVSSRLFDVAVYTILEMILDEEEGKLTHLTHL